MGNKVAGVVVLYNPEPDVVENVNSYIGQVGKLFVVDNSEVKNRFVIEELLKIENIEYIDPNENVGIGKAFNLAAKKSLELGFEWLLTMDQDSNASKNMIGEMFAGAEGIENVGLISPFHINKFKTKLPPDSRFTEMFDVMASGNLVNLDILSKLGFFNEDFFIDYVDVEYCLRLNKNGYKILQVNYAPLEHNEASIEELLFLGRKVYPYNHSPIRFYYKARNRKYLKKLFYKDFPDYFNKKEKNVFTMTLLKMLIFERNKIQKIKYIIKGMVDYNKSIKGKLVE